MVPRGGGGEERGRGGSADGGLSKGTGRPEGGLMRWCLTIVTWSAASLCRSPAPSLTLAVELSPTAATGESGNSSVKTA